MWTRSEDWSGALGDFYGRINGTAEATTRETDERSSSIITAHTYTTDTAYVTLRGSYLQHALREHGQESVQTRDLDRQLFASDGSGYLADKWRRTRWNTGLDAHATIWAAGEHTFAAAAMHETAADSLRDHLTGGRFVDAHARALLTRFVSGAPVREIDATLTSTFINDAWRWEPFRVNLGVRWDHQLVSGYGELSSGLLQPRLAFVWSPTDRMPLRSAHRGSHITRPP